MGHRKRLMAVGGANVERVDGPPLLAAVRVTGRRGGVRRNVRSFCGRGLVAVGQVYSDLTQSRVDKLIRKHGMAASNAGEMLLDAHPEPIQRASGVDVHRETLLRPFRPQRGTCGVVWHTIEREANNWRSQGAIFFGGGGLCSAL